MTIARPAIDFNLYLISDRIQVRKGTLLDVVGQALQGGVKAVQLREKDLASRDLLELAGEMRKLTSAHGSRLIINDRIDIALAVGADGVHLGEAGIPAPIARRLLGDSKLIGVSCHSQTSARAAQEGDADFITFGPVFPTPSKARYGKPVGIEQLALATKSLRIPLFALGGIKLGNTREVLQAGATGISLISAIISADDPCSETRLFLDCLSGTTQEESAP